MSDTPETHALLDRVDAAMRLIEIIRNERDQWRRMYKEADLRTVEDEVLKRERDEAQVAFAIAADQLVVAQSQAWQWRQCAERLAPFVVPVPADMADHAGCAEALAQFDRLKEGGE